ncbi:hypothetical protein BpHYR1_040702 [Brachionus plicatilis]|uniref:Uncharacterized protein n=1 Tax=Brachionus plicatilis TaxID=10195 RepID=A0A3M7QC62_BRAPC|nr:hypothetical protein BpHYR1_040702 [Brachionus plicatilis]
MLNESYIIFERLMKFWKVFEIVVNLKNQVCKHVEYESDNSKNVSFDIIHLLKLVVKSAIRDY